MDSFRQTCCNSRRKDWIYFSLIYVVIHSVLYENLKWTELSAVTGQNTISIPECNEIILEASYDNKRAVLHVPYNFIGANRKNILHWKFSTGFPSVYQQKQSDAVWCIIKWFHRRVIQCIFAIGISLI